MRDERNNEVNDIIRYMDLHLTIPYFVHRDAFC